MTTVYNAPEAQVLNRTEPERVPFWKKVKNFLRKVVGQLVKKTAKVIAAGTKKTSKAIELVVRVCALSTIGQFLLVIIGIYFTLWILGILYSMMGGFAFIAIIPVIMSMIGVEMLIMALNEDTMRKVAKQRRERSYA